MGIVGEIDRVGMTGLHPCNSSGHQFDTVQEAIDDLGGDGWVFVPEGTFSEALTISDNNVMLFGAGWSSIIDGGTTGHAIEISSDYCCVRDLQVKTDAGGGNNYDGIYLTGDYNTFLNIFVNGSDRCGIYGSGVIRKLVAGCYVYDSDGDGILTGGTSPFRIIIGNYVQQVGNTGIIGWGAADDAVIIGNVINTTANDGINVDGGDDDCVVDGNRITAWTWEAIDDNSGNSVIGDNDET